MPFCRQDHDEFHVMCRRAGVDFRATTDRFLRLIQALKAMLIGMWMVVDKLEKQARDDSEETPTDGTNS